MNYNYNRNSYKGFQLKAKNSKQKKELKKIVDDFYQDLEYEHNNTYYDLSLKKNMSISSKIVMTKIIQKNIYMHYTNNLCKLINIQKHFNKYFYPNLIQLKYMNTMRRVRSIAHSGLIGLLAIRLCINNSNILLGKKSIYLAKYVENKVNNKYSIKELTIQRLKIIYNSDNNVYKNITDINILISKFNEEYIKSDNVEFFQKLNEIIEKESISRYIKSKIILTSDWAIRIYYLTICIMRKYLDKIFKSSTPHDRGILVNDMCRFSLKLSWMTKTYKNLFNFNRFFIVYIKKMLELISNNGLEICVYVFANFYPEMMTKSIRPYISMTSDSLYFNNTLWISHTDEIVGSLKVRYRTLMPDGQNRCII